MKPIISKITNEWIAKNKPCQSALNMWDRKVKDPIKILKWLIKIKKYDWANWFIVRVMEYKDYVSYAVFAAEQVIDVYEKKYPNDKRPRQAIEAAKKCIENPSEENKARAAGAAGAAWAAAWAAGAAGAAEAAWAAGAAGAAMQLKILKYGMELLEVK